MKKKGKAFFFVRLKKLFIMLMDSESRGYALKRFLDELKHELNLPQKIHLFFVRSTTYLLDRRERKKYSLLSFEKIKAEKKSDKIFIFGSGYSINDISENEWEFFKKHNTLAFNWFPKKETIPMDFHLVGEIGNFDLKPKMWKPYYQTWKEVIVSNRLYQNTIFLIEEGYRCISGNRVIGLHLLPLRNRVLRFKKAGYGHLQEISREFSNGLVHGSSSLTLCINFEFLMGYRRIILVGVDLYDSRYFFLGKEETKPLDVRRGKTCTRTPTGNKSIPFA